VFNAPTYPNFARFLHLCGIPWKSTEMTFSVSRDQGTFEWAGKNPFTVFCQPSNLFKVATWRMLWDILRFNATASSALSGGQDVFGNLSLGEYLQQQGYSRSFIDDYMLVRPIF
jgi:predicted NAD/FAD-binding protein